MKADVSQLHKIHYSVSFANSSKNIFFPPLARARVGQRVQVLLTQSQSGPRPLYEIEVVPDVRILATIVIEHGRISTQQFTGCLHQRIPHFLLIDLVYAVSGIYIDSKVH